MKKVILILIVLVHQSAAFEFIPNEFDKLPVTSGRLTIGDINGDGFNDIISNGLISYNITGFCVTGSCVGVGYNDFAKIWVNNQQGGFEELPQQVEFRAIAEYYEGMYSAEYYEVPYTVIADLDNDGDNDLASSSGLVFLNNGSGVFDAPLDVGYSFSNSPIFAVDLNNDNVFELIVDKKIYTRVSTQPLKYINSSDIYLLNPKFQDMDNDGYQDVITFGNDNNIKVWINDKTGNFPENLTFTIYEKEPLNLEVGDLDGDSNVDIILSGNRLLKNMGNLEFELEELISSNGVLDDVTELAPRKLLHFNGDESLDLLLTVKFDNVYSDVILINDSLGGYEIDISNQVNSSYIFFNDDFNLLEDFNSDGIADLISSSSRVLNNNFLLGEDYPEFTFSDIFHQITSGFNLSLFTNKSNGYMYPSSGLIINNTSDFYLFDQNSDGKTELLFSDYSYNNENHAYINDNTLIFSDFKPNSVRINKFNLDFHLSEDTIDYMIPTDMNDDNKDDLLIEYLSCESVCERKREIWLNSDSGFSAGNSIELNFDSKAYLIADINGDGYNDFIKKYRQDVLSNSILIQENVGATEFLERNIQIPEFNTHIKAVLDVNNDTFDDIFFIDADSNLYVVFGNPELSELSAQLIGFYNINKMAFYDTNNNGNQDLYFIENQSNDLVHLEYGQFNYTFKSRAKTNVLEQLKQIHLADIDYDSNMDLITLGSTHVNIYQLNQLERYESVFEEQISSNTNKIILYDFDNDFKLDIALHDKVLFGRDLIFQTGLNYDPRHSGHGFSVENVGEGQFFTVFYTYDNEGNPEWYTNLGMFQQLREDYWNIRSDDYYGLVRTEYDYVNNITVQNTSNSYKGSLYHDSCSTTFSEIIIYYEIGVNSFGIPLSKDRWCSQPIVDYYSRPQEDFSGLWWAGGDDSGWGWSISLVERDETTDLVLVLYYYDAQGNPRWLIGQQSGFVKGQKITLDMNMVKGYSRQSTPTDLTFTPAGTISLTLKEVSNNLSKAGVMSIDVNYPGQEGGNWLRNDIPVALFSKPRNN